jgi:hypothetical protein
MWRMGLLVHGVRIEPSRSRLPIGIHLIVIRPPRHGLNRNLLRRNSCRGRLVWMGRMGSKSRTGRNRRATGSTRARHGSRRGTSAIRHGTREGR